MLTATNMTNKAAVTNPYLRCPFGTAHNAVKMGRQCQQWINNTKRAFRSAQVVKKKRKGDQLTLDSQRAFQAEQDCMVCNAKELQRFTPSTPIPKRAHHHLCIKNTKTRERGNLNQATVASEAEEKRLKAHFSEPLNAQEKCSGKYATKEAGVAFFSVRKTPTKPTTINCKTINDMSPQATTVTTTTIDFCKGVSMLVADPEFREKHKAKNAPLAMLAVAGEVVEKVMRAKDNTIFDYYFNGMTMTVPPVLDSTNKPHCHSNVGQKLLLVDWKRVFGINRLDIS